MSAFPLWYVKNVNSEAILGRIGVYLGPHCWSGAIFQQEGKRGEIWNSSAAGRAKKVGGAFMTTNGLKIFYARMLKAKCGTTQTTVFLRFWREIKHLSTFYTPKGTIRLPCITALHHCLASLPCITALHHCLASLKKDQNYFVIFALFLLSNFAKHYGTNILIRTLESTTIPQKHGENREEWQSWILQARAEENWPWSKD